MFAKQLFAATLHHQRHRVAVQVSAAAVCNSSSVPTAAIPKMLGVARPTKQAGGEGGRRRITQLNAKQPSSRLEIPVTGARG